MSCLSEKHFSCVCESHEIFIVCTYVNSRFCYTIVHIILFTDWHSKTFLSRGFLSRGRGRAYCIEVTFPILRELKLSLTGFYSCEKKCESYSPRNILATYVHSYRTVCKFLGLTFSRIDADGFIH